jgi:superfamily II DNA or RNA helicase/HKD family nuclease/diadenosine tetraphosphate (Ap4A) HIT family hydrolase
VTSEACPFCRPQADRLFFVSDLVLGLWDAFPVSPGHALLVTKRHVGDWFAASQEERHALTDAIDAARRAICERHQPDGFNLGVNVGSASGQTIPHLHLHVIPRYTGDVPDPRGGVRYVVPKLANYLAQPADDVGESRRLVTGGDDDPLFPHLAHHLTTAESVDIVVSFVLRSGVDRIFEHLRDLLARGARLRLLTGDYLGITDPNALMRLLDLEGRVEVRVFETGQDGREMAPGARSFHPKAYIFSDGRGGTAFIGSSNLSAAALTSAIEWNYRVVSSREGSGYDEIVAAFDRLFHHPSTRALTPEWVETYRLVRPEQAAISEPVDAAIEPALPPVTPNEVQLAALEALEATRVAGNKAGLVVLATGLGKTWLSAFDTNRPEFRRVLFVAHREEILNQALDTFRRIRPEGRFGRYTGEQKDLDADVLFASIQTLGRRQHLEAFSPEFFDYVIVDEFHHAAAATYRKLIGWFQPKFLLGLTATPERTDGGDLLALCQQNLVYRCDLVEGVRRDLLAPFHYFGVPDEVDYTNIPWRSTRFDEESLTNAVATHRRAENALEQFRKRAAKRALGFCVSQRHADFMARFFNDRGVRAVSVHAGPTSAPRAPSLERLSAGDLDIVFAVDMFNEGVDLPNLDTVLMLRPTESRILWLQQFGRGLRKAPDKERLTVVDYIGNHRVFLLKPQTLFGLPSGDREVLNLLERLRDGSQELPPGCEVTYELETVEILKALLRVAPGQVDALEARYDDFKALHDQRPTALELYEEGYNPRAVRPKYPSWMQFVASRGDLSAASQQALDAHRAFIDVLDVTPMVKSYKMLVLLGMLNAGQFPGALSVAQLAGEVRKIAGRTRRAAEDLEGSFTDEQALIRLLIQNAIDAWAGGKGTRDTAYFSYEDGVFKTTFVVAPDLLEPFQEMVREVAEWRLAEYLDRKGRDKAGHATLKVSHASGRPILFLPQGPEREDLPEGWTEVEADGERLSLNFVKIAVNVARRGADEANVLPEVLRRWFGEDAGAPGTRHNVSLKRDGDLWKLSPTGVRHDRVQLWRSYSREEIPELFGFTFNPAIWNAGFAKRPRHIFLLATLDKSGHGSEFQYKDHFVSRTEFEWQSQNRTRQESSDGQDIRDHASRDIAVHLFVRDQKKRAGGGAARFIYCGDVTFKQWSGERPITVRWRLDYAIPDAVWASLGPGAAVV